MRRVPRPDGNAENWAVQIVSWLEDFAKKAPAAIQLRRGSAAEPGLSGQMQYDGARVIWHDGAAWAPLGARVSAYASRNASPVDGELAVFTDGIGGGGSPALAAYYNGTWV